MTDGWDIAAPRADALIESLRAFGYSTESAVADLVDNSISVGSKSITVDFTWNGANSTVRIADDGWGMSESELVAAMRPGSMSPLDPREATDLGRFGLGLKTASFSQARELTVVSTTPLGRTSARRWDLDVVTASGEWRLLRSEPQNTPAAAPTPASGGTVVQWSKLDRLVGDVEPTDNRAHSRFLRVVDRVRQHLESTFHRFLVGQGRVSITVNGVGLVPWDPFMTKHPASQRLENEELPFRGSLIRVTPYVLPHRSKLDQRDSERGAGIRGWTQQQGFYVYRSQRLLVQGDWLGLGASKDEHTKLARIAIEFPASLDHDWQVDVKKSTARPPHALVDDLGRIAKATRRRAEGVYRHRGKIITRSNSRPFVLAWNQYKNRDGHVRYQINRKHPVIGAVLDAAGKEAKTVERALRFIEETLPTTQIGVAIADALDTQPAPFGDSSREVKPLFDFVFHGLVADGATAEEAVNHIAVVEPFIHYPEVVEAYKEQLL